MSALNWLALLALLVAAYLATLHLALYGVSHSAFLSARGGDASRKWLLDRRRPILLAASLLLTVSRTAFFLLTLLSVVGTTAESQLTTGKVILAGALAIAGLWLFTAVLASAVAHHAGTTLLVASTALLRLLAALGTPLAGGMSLVDEIVRRLSGSDLNHEDIVEAELLRSIEDSQLEGHLDPSAAELMENVVEFRSTDVGEVMTPRTDIRGIEFTDDLAQIRQVISALGYSRIPVYQENLDHIVGILYVKDLVPYLGEDASEFQLKPLLRQPIMVPQTKPVSELLADFQRSEVHMAIVIDEYGGTAGLVTIEDVLEELVGEIQDEHDPDTEEIPALTSIDEAHAEVDGRYHIDDLNAQLGLDLPEDEEFDTIGGFVLAKLGRVPRKGDTFESHQARFTAIDATPTHVRRIGIELLAPVLKNGERRSNGSS